MALSIAIILDTRREKNLGKYPVKLRVISNRKTKDYLTIYDLTKDEYNKFSAPRINSDLHDIRASLQEMETNAKKFALGITPFSFENFESRFVNTSTNLRKRKKRKHELTPVKEAPQLDFDLSKFEKNFYILKEKSSAGDFISVTFISYIRNLLEEERIGTALSYQNAYYSFKNFSGDVPFSTITKGYLMRYEKWMTEKKDCTLATVGINARALRAMFNEAIDGTKIISRDIYPFGKRKYRIPTSKGSTQALLKEDIKTVFEYEPDNYSIRRGKAYWLFCFYGNGMNPSDMATLKYKDIQGDFIKFIRNKTKLTTKENPILISVYLTDKLKQIINEWGSEDRSPNNYIFPVLNDEMNVMEEYSRIRTFTKYLNDSMKAVFEQLKFEKKINNKVCRKSFATILKRAGVPLEYIQGTLGHLHKSTTETYYTEDYEDDVKKDFSLMISSIC